MKDKQLVNGWSFILIMLVTGINMMTMPFLSQTTLWGAVFAGFFVWTNWLGKRHRKWLSLIWGIISIAVILCILTGQELTDQYQLLASSFSFFAASYYAVRAFRKK